MEPTDEVVHVAAFFTGLVRHLRDTGAHGVLVEMPVLEGDDVVRVTFAIQIEGAGETLQ